MGGTVLYARPFPWLLPSEVPIDVYKEYDILTAHTPGTALAMTEENHDSIDGYILGHSMLKDDVPVKVADECRKGYYRKPSKWRQAAKERFPEVFAQIGPQDFKFDGYHELFDADAGLYLFKELADRDIIGKKPVLFLTVFPVGCPIQTNDALKLHLIGLPYRPEEIVNWFSKNIA
ncbi:MAG: hypothetical protein KJ709_05065 [Nanoarchaeota archaeon]|nr:hypothetical protein [Nanoarchaeota archaeon]